MERNRRYHMTEDDRADSATALFAPRKDGQVMRKQVRQPGSLEIIENGGSKAEKYRPPSETSSRSLSRASIGSVPPRSESSLSRRTMTPTKQISLQAVKRKEESSDPFIDDVEIDLDSFTFDGTRHRNKKWSINEDFRHLSEDSFVDDENIDSGAAGDHRISSTTVESASFAEKNVSDIDSKKLKQHMPEHGGKKEVGAAKASASASGGQKKSTKKESSSEDDDDDDDEGEEKPKLRAPNELLMEFVDCLMKEDYPNADKLCKMILMYEPENPEALMFQPLIQEKMQLDAEAAEEDDSDEEDSDDDDDDSDDDDSDDNTTSSDDSDDDDDDKIIPSTSTKAPNYSDIKGANSVHVWKPSS